MHPIGLKKSKLTVDDRQLTSRMTIFLLFLIGFRYLRTVISVIGPDPLELVRTKFSNQPIPIFYQIINRPPPAISFLNNKTINYNKK